MKIKYLPQLLFILLLLFFQKKSFAQMGINSTGTPPASNAMLDISSTTKGLLIPRMTTIQRTALAHTTGLTVFDITTNGYWYSDGSNWVNIATVGNSSPWLTSGNNIYKSSTAGNVGIGTTNPTDKLSIVNALAGYGITHTFGAISVGTYISNYSGQFGTKTNHPLEFFTNNGTPQMTLFQNGNIGIGKSGGKVGIGNSNPQLGLDIDARIRIRQENYIEGLDHPSAFSVPLLLKITPESPLITVKLKDKYEERYLMIENGIQGEIIVVHCLTGGLIIYTAGGTIIPGVISNIQLQSGAVKELTKGKSIQLIFIDGIWSEI
jgi:hypothetical protein